MSAMDDLETRLTHLARFLPLTENNFEAFLSEVASVTGTGDPRAVKPVLLLADDHCQLGGVMSRMLALLEDVPIDAYVEELLKALPEFDRKSPFSSENEIRKLLWSDHDRRALASAASGLEPEQATALHRVLERVDSPELATAVTEVRRALPEWNPEGG